MSAYVADTHALLWYLTASNRLGGHAKSAFDEGASGNATIYLPVIVLAELYFLNTKLGQPVNFIREMQRLKRSSQFVFVPFAADDVLDFDRDNTVTQMHDRMIVGVARRLNATLLTLDGEIVSSRLVATTW